MQDQLLLQLDTFESLASRLTAERKRQGLSRAQAASVCNVSTSFIRDAETQPGRCSLAKLSQVINGLGLTMTVAGWQVES
jgi:HTH-type transcriptional regulator/antitoxin HipB